MAENRFEAVVIGGSLGGLEAISKILSMLPNHFQIPIIIVLHRLKNVQSSLIYLLNQRTELHVKEINDKMKIEAGNIYVAPANYHVLIEKDRSFSLDCSQVVNFCRPSIDVLFESAALTYKKSLIGIVITGANHDGSRGLKEIYDRGGFAIVQEPGTAESDIMPVSAIQATKVDRILNLSDIGLFLANINK